MSSLTMSNPGLLLGRVYSVGGGATAPNVQVAITSVWGQGDVGIAYAGGAGERKYIWGKTDSKGEFAIPFAWSPTSVADNLTHGWIDVVALNEVSSRGHDGVSWSTTTQTTSRASGRARSVIIKDVANLLRTAGSTFNSAPEIADAGLDLWGGIRKVKMYPVWKAGALLTTGSWMIVAGIELTLA